MNRCLPVLALALSLARAWSSPQLYNVCNSAAAPNGTVWVNADIWDVPRDDITATLYYSLDNQASWQTASMSVVGGADYDSTFAASFPAPASGSVYYYVRASNGTNYGTEGPYNSGNSWPPGDNWLAEFCPEGTGDTFNAPRGEYLDLTSAAFGRSGDRFYGRLTNHSSSWPLDAGILGPWFLYSVGFANADAPSDSWGYAMTYANVAGIYTSGLYELNKYSSSFTRIGGIDVQTSGNRLVMRCLISDLTARPHWGPWPNTSGFLSSTRADTRSAILTLESWQHDSTFPGRFYINKTPVVPVGQNSAPVLSGARVVPQVGVPGTNFWFMVHYTDADSHLPVRRCVVVDGDTYSLPSPNHRYWQDVTFEMRRAWTELGWHRFHYLFDDGMQAVTTTEDSFLVSATAVAEEPARAARGLAAFPNPFTRTVRLSLSRPGRVLEIMDGRGKLVRRLLGLAPGQRIVDWDGRDDRGGLLPHGVYFCREEGGPLRRLLMVKLRS